MKKRSFLILTLIVIAFASATMTWRYLVVSKPSTLKVLIQGQKPFSTDPLQYDAFIHHHIYRSVLGTLVTQYRRGEIVGTIAQTWSANPSFDEWHFEIDPTVSWEDGTPIEPKQIALSLARLGFMLQKKGSVQEFFQKLKGGTEISSPTAISDGITYTDTTITLRFKTSIPNLLEILSFGNYAIARPDQYNSATGEWIDPQKSISANAYRIIKADPEFITLKLRDDYPKRLRHVNAFDEIHIDLSNNQPSSSYDLVIGSSSENIPELKFFGPVPSSIAYVHCYSWKQKGSICSDRKDRQLLRELLYDRMTQLGVNVTRSFFPLSMKGISEMPEDSRKTDKLINRPTKIEVRKSAFNTGVYKGFNLAIVKILEQLGVAAELKTYPIQEVVKMLEPQAKHQAELGIMTTGVLIEDPIADVKFMILSKEGIRLPDEDGDLVRAVNNSYLDVQKINKILWEQAIIWPLGHFSLGIWVSDRVDVSSLNIVQPPIDFAWIGNKK